MTKSEAEHLCAPGCDWEPSSYEEATELFRAIFGHAPGADDGDQWSVFSHCCSVVGLSAASTEADG